MTIGPDDSVCSGELAAALEACRTTLADYEAGLLSDHELREALHRVGLVQGASETWLLDLEHGAWRRYDGVSLSEPGFRVQTRQVAQWRRALERLRDEMSGR